jgi:hypothetical protein
LWITWVISSADLEASLGKTPNPINALSFAFVEVHPVYNAWIIRLIVSQNEPYLSYGTRVPTVRASKPKTSFREFPAFFNAD